MERPVLQLQSSSRRNRRSSFLGTEAVKLLVPSPVGRNPVPPSLVEERSGIAEGRNSPSFSTTHRKFNSVDSGDSQNLDPNSMLSESFDFSDISPKVLRQLSAGKQRKSKGSAHGESPLLHMVLGESPRSSRSSRSNSLLDDSFVTANDERSACSDIDSPCGDAFGNYTVKNQMGSFGSPSSLRNKSLRLKHNNGSTEKHHGPLQPLSSSINYAVQQFDFNRINEENASLKRQLRQKDDIIEKLYSRNTSLQAENERLDNLRAMSIEDVHATNFMNGILELKISELEDVISQDRLKHNEKLASKVKKHKAQAKKLNEERQSYENRANQMIQQMTEQMTLLQKTAMERIQVIISS